MTALRRTIAVWLQAVRPFAFPASVIPVAVAGSYAFAYGPHADWELFPLILVCAVLFHGGTNLVSEYFDFRKGVDKKQSFGAGNVLVKGLLTPRQVLAGGFVSFAAGCLLGLVLYAARGSTMLVFAGAGLAGGIAYTAPPAGYKYIGLGDVMVFFLMGPLMVAGAFFALTGTLSTAVWMVSIPVGALVAAILNANNIRDMAHDREAGIVTLELVIGAAYSKALYAGLLILAYVSVAVYVITGMLSPLALVVALSLPLALKNLKVLFFLAPDRPEFVMLDILTARLHLVFGALLCLSLFLSGVAA